MSKTRPVPPSASALIGSLRGVGYSLETATADIVDNSVSAGAKVVDITWSWCDGSPTAAIFDDGRGMSEGRLIEAMRFGGIGVAAERKADDLGRFGLGLKTASLSQCRRLTVCSKEDGAVSTFTWDVDRIHESSDWDLIEGPEQLSPDHLDRLNSFETGTLVLWQKIDFGRVNDRPDHIAFLADLERLERHLGMVFHRFLTGDARRIVIRLNGREVEAWDPFVEDEVSTIRSPEQHINAPGGRIKVQGFVLPHRDRFRNEDAFERAGGPDGWTAQQGFYVYRQKRLLSAGGWLGLGGSRAWTREEPSRLARIRVDIPNTADHDWRIDIRKAIARPPDAIRKALHRIAEDVRRKAREVFVHRGHHGPRRRDTDVSRIWAVRPGASRRRYVIERNHTLVRTLKERLSAADVALLEALFDLIERTVPVDRVWLDVSEQGIPDETHNSTELVKAAREMVGMLTRAGLPLEVAAARVACMDPFDRVEGLADKLAANGGSR